MMIPGWEDDPLVDGAPQMSDQAFWAAFLESAMGVEDVEALEEAFEAGAAEAEEALERLCDPEAWPVFRVPLRSGAVLNVIHRNLEDDPGIDYVLTGPDLPNAVRLAAVEGHFAGPGLAWSELTDVAKNVVGGDLTAAARLLLLLPATGEADLPEDSVAVVAEALTGVGAVAHAEKIAHVMLYDRVGFWAPAGWTVRSDGALLCDGPHSPRGFSPVALPSADLLAVTKALAAG